MPAHHLPHAMKRADAPSTDGDSPVADTDKNKAVPSEIQAPSKASSIQPTLAIETGEAAPPTQTFLEIPQATDMPLDGSGSGSGSNSGSLTGSSDKPESSKDSTSDDNSTGTKAGIAFGIIGSALLIAGLIFFWFMRRKSKTHKRKKSADAEKHAQRRRDDQPAVERTLALDAMADQRPVTTFFSPQTGVDKPLPSLNAVTPPPAAARLKVRPSRNSTDAANPFGDHTDFADPFGANAERVPSPDLDRQMSRSPSPIQVNQALPRGSRTSSNFEPAAAVAPLAPLTRKTSLRKDGVGKREPPLPQLPGLDAVPGSPTTTAHAAGDSTVHRVQQDFEPTMDDEMRLRAGQLVRLLHEFDDGWALCSRMDTSQQGVVPRTCISTRPLKPRTEGRPPQSQGSGR
jgi:hypothetical protein